MERKKLGRFPEGVLKHIARTIGDYMSGSEISELLINAGYPERSTVAGTKWRFLYDIFKEFNERLDGQLHIAKIVEAFCDPTQWINEEPAHKKVMNILNEGLIHINLQLNEDGKIIIAQRKVAHIVKVEPHEVIASRFMTVAPVFRARETKPDEDLCFVLMPFKPSFGRLYKEKIKPTVEACGLKCLRADDLFSPTPILEDIWVCICKSKVIIADVTSRNPNVFYEMGIAHTVGKPVIIIAQDKSDIPFDVSQFRYFLYSDDASGWDTLCNNITSALRSTIGGH